VGLSDPADRGCNFPMGAGQTGLNLLICPPIGQY
jgi:hypothetical protein